MKTLVAYVPGRNNYHFNFLPSYRGSSVNTIESDRKNRLANINEYANRLKFARENGYEHLSIRGYGEPILNKSYLEMIDTLNNRLSSPFQWIELKTNGSLLTDECKESEENIEFLKQSGIKTIVLYLTAFDDFKHNQLVSGNSIDTKFNIKSLCEKIKVNGFNLRIEMFLMKWLEYITVDEFMRNTKELCVDQITMKVPLLVEDDSTVNEAIKISGCRIETIERLQENLKEHTPIGTTTTGYPIYSINNISVVLHDGSHKNETSNLYLLPNSKLYRKSDDLGSLIF